MQISPFSKVSTIQQTSPTNPSNVSINNSNEISLKFYLESRKKAIVENITNAFSKHPEYANMVNKLSIKLGHQIELVELISKEIKVKSSVYKDTLQDYTITYNFDIVTKDINNSVRVLADLYFFVKGFELDMENKFEQLRFGKMSVVEDFQGIGLGGICFNIRDNLLEALQIDFASLNVDSEIPGLVNNYIEKKHYRLTEETKNYIIDEYKNRWTELWKKLAELELDRQNPRSSIRPNDTIKKIIDLYIQMHHSANVTDKLLDLIDKNQIKNIEESFFLKVFQIDSSLTGTHMLQAIEMYRLNDRHKNDVVISSRDYFQEMQFLHSSLI